MPQLSRRGLLPLAAASLIAQSNYKLRQFESLLNPAASLAQHNIPHLSLAIIENARVSVLQTYGPSITPQSRFQAASISKPLAAAAALHMAHYGNFTLDEEVNKFLSSWRVPANEFTQSEKVTVRRILSHSAGLTVHGFPGYPLGATLPTVHEILDGKPPANTAPIRVDLLPGSKFRYSGGGYTVLQLLLAERFKKPFADLMQTIVLTNCKLRNSSFQNEIPPQTLAPAHNREGKPYNGLFHRYPEQAAAGLWTTPEDLALFAIEIARAASGRSTNLLEKSQAQLLLTPQIENQALGFQSRNGWFRHGGANAGYRCHLICRHDASHGLAVMTNSDNGDKIFPALFQSAAQTWNFPTL
jgi:CubicO group peptidase (beta-lactamase class C family)